MTLASSNADDRAVVRNSLAQYGSLAVTIGLGVVLTPALIRNLGPTRFGAWTVALALTGFIGLGELGLGTATVRRVAAEFARGDQDAISRVASTSLAIYLGTAAAGLILLGAAISVTGAMLDVPPAVLGQARVAVLLVGAAACVSFLLNVYPAVLTGAGRSDLLTVAGTSTGLLTGVGQIATVVLTNDLRALAAVSAVGVICGGVVIRSVARRQHPSLAIGLRHADLVTARELLGSGWRNAVITITALAAFNADVLIVGAYLSAVAVAAYGVAARAAGLLSTLTFRLSEVLVPTYSHYDAGGKKERIYRMYVETTLAAWAIAVPGGIVLAAFGGELLQGWLGKTPPGAPQVLTLLALSVVVAVPGGAAYFLLSGIDELRFAVRASLLTGFLNAAAGIALTPLVGLTGPAIATLAIRTVYDLGVLPVHACRVLGFGSAGWWREVAGVIVPPTIVAAAAALAARSLFDVRDPLLAAGMSVLLTLAFGAALLTSAGAERRARYVGLLRRPARSRQA